MTQLTATRDSAASGILAALSNIPQDQASSALASVLAYIAGMQAQAMIIGTGERGREREA